MTNQTPTPTPHGRTAEDVAMDTVCLLYGVHPDVFKLASLIEAHVQERLAAPQPDLTQVREALEKVMAGVDEARQLISYHGQDMQPSSVAEENTNKAFKILRGLQTDAAISTALKARSTTQEGGQNG